MKVHASIEYLGQDGNLVHSDLCPRSCDPKNMDADYRKLLHEALDEWLINGEGTGFFIAKQEGWNKDGST